MHQPNPKTKPLPEIRGYFQRAKNSKAAFFPKKPPAPLNKARIKPRFAKCLPARSKISHPRGKKERNLPPCSETIQPSTTKAIILNQTQHPHHSKNHPLRNRLDSPLGREHRAPHPRQKVPHKPKPNQDGKDLHKLPGVFGPHRRLDIVLLAAFQWREATCREVLFHELVLFVEARAEPGVKLVGVIEGDVGDFEAPPVEVDRLWRAALEVG
jgi:hypothetical protein